MARGRKSPLRIFLAPAERAQLEHWHRSTTIQAGLAKRAQIILLRAEGLARSKIARRLAVGRRLVRKWLQRFINKRTPGLADKAGRDRKSVFSPRGGGASGQAGLRAAG
jgi:Homeodomain-like domain